MSCLNRFKGWCQENFPFIEDDFNAITDYQLMCKLKEYVVSIGNDVANLEIDYNELAGKIAELEEIVNSMDEEFDDLVEEFNSLKTLVESYNMRIQANANRIEQVNTNLQQLISLNIDDVKDLINSLKDYVDDQDTLILADISTINENIVLIRKDIEVLAQGIPKVRDTGTIITLNDTIKDAHIDIKLDPSELSQVTTTGKNLLPATSRANASNGILSTANEDGSITISGTATSNWFIIGTSYVDVSIPAGTYTFSIQQSLPFNVKLDFTYDDDTTGNAFTITSGNTSRTATLEKNVKQIFIEATSVTSSTAYNNTIYFQLESGSSATSFEKYTGGIPQPNPQYPSDIHVISGDNEIVVSNSDNTLSQIKPLTLGNIEYCKIGNYQDNFFKTIDGDSIYDALDSTTKASLTSGKWYIQKNIGKVVLDGTLTNVSISYSKTNTTFFQTTAIASLPLPQGTLASGMCDKLIAYTSALYSNDTDNGFTFSVNGYLRINLLNSLTGITNSDNDTTKINKFITWLSNNNATLYYSLATPTYTLLNDTLQQQLDDIYETLKAYNDQTNITQINHDLPFIMTAITMKKGSVTDEV